MSEIPSDESVEMEDSAEEEPERPKAKTGSRNRTMWVQKALLTRDSQGEFVQLYQKLLDDDIRFYDYFRMTKQTFAILKEKLNDSLKKKDTKWRKAIDPTHRLAVCLRFLITGDSLRSISKNYRLGHSTVYFIVKDTCRIIVETLLSEVMCPPVDRKWRQIAMTFNKLRKFPNCVGVIDGKEIVFQNSAKRRWESANDSMILLAIVDAQCNFIGVEVGTYSQSYDGAVLAQSILGIALDRGELNIPEKAHLPGTTDDVPFVFIGNESFPSKNYLLRPYCTRFVGDDETVKVFNTRMSHAKQVFEEAFLMLSQRFGIYRKKMQLKPENADHIILATCVLHNFIKKYEDFIVSDVKTQTAALRNLPKQGGSAKKEAMRVRDMFKTYFNSEQGSVPP